MLEKIIYKKKLLALIVRGKYRNRKGITFFTSNESTQQFGYMKHKKKHNVTYTTLYTLPAYIFTRNLQHVLWLHTAT